jgi:flagellar motor component MotA
MVNFKEFSKSLGLATVALGTAVIGVNVASLATSNPITAIAATTIAALTIEASKQMLLASHEHFKEAFKNDHVEASAPTHRKYLS